MNSDIILHKYMRHLRYIDQGNIVHLAAVELALRLALDELEEAIDTATSAADCAVQILKLQADLERLQTAANAEVADLRSQLAQLDADNVALIRRNKELSDELHIARNGAGLAIKNPPFANGPADGAAQSPISNLQSPMWDDLTLLDDEAADWWIGCDTGRHQWRSVPKPIQLRMVRHIISFGPETGDMPMREFDAIKPDWMPSSNSHTKTLNLSWSQVNDFRVELEATR